MVTTAIYRLSADCAVNLPEGTLDAPAFIVVVFEDGIIIETHAFATLKDATKLVKKITR